MTQLPDPKKIFIVHGRNHRVRDELIRFLEALKLQALTWGEARAIASRETGRAGPTIQEIIGAGMRECKVIVTLLTPDEEVELKAEFVESAADGMKAEQARPNVIFEAGLALGLYPDRLLVVEAGSSRALSDLDGVHRISLANGSGKGDLKLALEGLCPVEPVDHWEDVGDFSEPFEHRYEAWVAGTHRGEHLLTPKQLVSLRRGSVAPESRPRIYAFALASAVQCGPEADVPYWIGQNSDSRTAVRALLDCVVYSRDLASRLRAAKALECMKPHLVATAIVGYARNVPAEKLRNMELAKLAQDRGVTAHVQSHPEPVEGLSAGVRIELLAEFEQYPPYRGRAFGGSVQRRSPA